MNHTPPLAFNLGKEAMAYWSLEPKGHLIMFVHGFNGNATKTWTSFPYGLLEDDSVHGADLVFYGYESLRQGAAESGVQLYDEINKLWTSSSAFVNKSPYKGRVEDFRYTKLTLIAHSLGAGVARQCLIEHFRNGNPWGTDIRLVLFAPAHRGANAAKLVGEALVGGGIVGAIIGILLELRYQSIRDLKPGSQFLQSLLEESRSALESQDAPAIYVKARKIFWAEADMVVTNERFLEDPTPLRMKKRTHMSVCKPDRSYQSPIEVLKEVLLS